MSYEESKLLSLLKKQDIDSLFLEATNYLCQTKSLFEEKKQLQQENEQLKDNWSKLKEFIKKSLEAIDTIQKLTGNAIENYTPRILTYKQIKDKMQEIEGSDSND